MREGSVAVLAGSGVGTGGWEAVGVLDIVSNRLSMLIQMFVEAIVCIAIAKDANDGSKVQQYSSDDINRKKILKEER